MLWGPGSNSLEGRRFLLSVISTEVRYDAEILWESGLNLLLGGQCLRLAELLRSPNGSVKCIGGEAPHFSSLSLPHCRTLLGRG